MTIKQLGAAGIAKLLVQSEVSHVTVKPLSSRETAGRCV